MCDNWQTTAEMYGSLFQKPKMTEKLLNKPPFRFIFDIIQETTKATGFANGLYPGEEGNSAHYSDKEKKLIFLKKLIELTQYARQTKLDVKPTKIVAGMEPENTNILLQEFYKAAKENKNSDKLVNKVLEKNGQGSGGSEQPQQEEKQQQRQEPAQQQQNQKPLPPPDDENEQPVIKMKKPSKKPTRQEPEQQQQQQQEQPRNVIREGASGNFEENQNEEQVSQQQNIKTFDSKGQHGKFIQNALNEDDDVINQKQESSVPQSSGGGIKMGKKRIGQKSKKTHGGEGGSARKGSGGASQDDIESLIKQVQSICQNSNPLGKSLEFINDDIESMNNELQKWNRQYQASKDKMQKELRITEENLSPLQDKIHEIELQISDEKAKIQNMKTQIIKNQYIIFAIILFLFQSIYKCIN
ncbi:hypothetical protein PPERSA_13124 [Pseudocohnilembus persalinus]|uniref:TRAF3-interacting protein 1 n=1 Tax=Pseudocohnilembus persalinus TaxID=266149 RepID=A0A0V0QXN5_PSEPJ|nr:hypothetical protein PPERSA_13124 [Pseudocohnilembus persalinus]|eukprot:KRX06645.1 hypothetical protein PPERSA_13124 [Pseudocohnilembus persalinus]